MAPDGPTMISSTEGPKVPGRYLVCCTPMKSSSRSPERWRALPRTAATTAPTI
jgi:hypothetical protein